jgi:hypothetical protein
MYFLNLYTNINHMRNVHYCINVCLCPIQLNKNIVL